MGPLLRAFAALSVFSASSVSSVVKDFDFWIPAYAGMTDSTLFSLSLCLCVSVVQKFFSFFSVYSVPSVVQDFCRSVQDHVAPITRRFDAISMHHDACLI